MSTDQRPDRKSSSQQDPWQTKRPNNELANRPHETVIIHCDGSYQREGNLAAVGYVISTRGGDVIEKHYEPVEAATTNAETEAHAFLQALRAGKRFNPSYVVINSDCDTVVEQVKRETSRSMQPEIYQSIQLELDPITHVSIKCPDRRENEDAHDLAHLSLRKLRARQDIEASYH